MQTFGERLTLLRKQAGVSQEELALEIGVSRQTVSYWENDKIHPLSESIVALCAFFNVKPEYFLTEGVQSAENNLIYEVKEEKPKKKSRKTAVLAALAVALVVVVLIISFFAYVYAPIQGTSSTVSGSSWNFDDITTILELIAGILAFAVICIAVYLVIRYIKNKKK